MNTYDVKRIVEANNVVPLRADWTDGSAEIKSLLNAYGSNSIPFYLIFPAERPDEPIILRDLISKSQVVEALNKAGPSKSVTGTGAATAMKGVGGRE